MKQPDLVVGALVRKHQLPDDLFKLIYLLLERDYTEDQEQYTQYIFNAFDFIFSRLPTVKEYDPDELYAPISELARIGLVEAVALSNRYFRRLTESDLLPEQKRYTGDPIDRFLGYTIFKPVLEYRLSFNIPYRTRFEHTHIIGPTGSGKTQLLQQLILSDIKRQCTVIVIDSQSDLINNIKRLKDIPTDRLVIIDPSDVEYPVALNVFDIGQHRLAKYSKLDYERHINGVIELLSYVFTSILGAELTQKQGVALNFVLRLMLHIPGATIHTLRNIMSPKGLELYVPYIDNLSDSGQQFFRTEFNSKAFEETKTQVLRRLYGILENPTIERLFSNRESRLDMSKEMNAGKVILISTAKDLLKSQGCTFFGRFFINLIAQATLERASQRPQDRTPTFVYIDECVDYVDPTINTILEQSRKYNLGMTLAHQQLAQLPEDVKASITNNTSTKFVGGVTSTDARALAPDMRVEPEYLRGQKKLHFSLYVRGYLPKPVTVKVKAGKMENEPRRTKTELAELLTLTRNTYALKPEPPPVKEVVQKSGEKAPDPDDDIESLNKT